MSSSTPQPTHSSTLRRPTWALHEVRRDLIVVNVWHKKLEWGFDCHVLSRDEAAEIGDQVEALRHTEPEGGFLRAAANLYESDASEAALRRGWISMTLWVPRLLRILLWTGSVRWPGRTLPTQL